MSDLHDIKTPWTPEELEEFKLFFRTLPTYIAVGGYALTCDMEAIVKFLKMDRAEERTKAYKKYWDDLDGKVYEDLLIPIMACEHDPTKLPRVLAETYDLDKNGFISPSEFATLLKTLIVYDSRVPNVSFEQFLKEADTNADGKVSIDEATDWIQQQLDHKK